MNKPTREDLLGYLLGALDAPEHEQVVICLQTRPDIRLELCRLRERISPLCVRPAAGDFPVGLARRTCEAVARQTHTPAPHSAQSPPQAQPVRSAPQRLRALQGAAIVCLAAVLGGTIGPTAYQTLSAASAPAMSEPALAVSGPTLVTAGSSVQEAWTDPQNRQLAGDQLGVADTSVKQSPAFAGSLMPIRTYSTRGFSR